MQQANGVSLRQAVGSACKELHLATRWARYPCKQAHQHGGNIIPWHAASTCCNPTHILEPCHLLLRSVFKDRCHVRQRMLSTCRAARRTLRR